MTGTEKHYLTAIFVVVCAAAGCGGPLANARLDPLEESQRRVLFSASFPSLDRTDGTIGKWGEDQGDKTPIRTLVFSLFGLGGPAVKSLAADRPVGIAVIRADRPDPKGSIPGMLTAISFSLKDADVKQWLNELGEVEDHSRSFHLVRQRFLAEIGQGLYRKTVWVKATTYWVHVEGNEVMLSNDAAGLMMAGPAARAARRSGGDDVAIEVHPPIWARSQKQDLARWLGSRLTYLRQGRLPKAEDVSPAGATLVATNAYYYLHALMDASTAVLSVKFDTPGVEVRLRTTPPGGQETAPPLSPPVLDRTLLTEAPPAALGALDCRGRMFVRQRALNRAWQETGGPGVAELNQMVDAQEQTLDGTCSFAVHTDNDVWADEASYRLRSGASAESLTSSIVAALRSGGLANLHSAQDDLKTAKLLLTTDDDVFGVDRVLGATATLEAQHAAALHGGATLRDRYSVRGDRLLSVSGARAPERLEKLSKPSGAGSLPEELERALRTGRGKAGFVFLDMFGLWRPFLKAGLVIKSPLAEAVAKTPTMLKQRRPLVITMEPSAGLDATVTMTPPTFGFLFAAGALLLAD